MVVSRFGVMIRMTVIVVVSSFCMMIRMALAIFWCGRNAIAPKMMALNPICCSFH